MEPTYEMVTYNLSKRLVTHRLSFGRAWTPREILAHCADIAHRDRETLLVARSTFAATLVNKGNQQRYYMGRNVFEEFPTKGAFFAYVAAIRDIGDIRAMMEEHRPLDALAFILGSFGNASHRNRLKVLRKQREDVGTMSSAILAKLAKLESDVFDHMRSKGYDAAVDYLRGTIRAW